MSRRAWLCALAAVFCACATPAVVIIGRSYDPSKTLRVALVGFSDYPGSAGSGQIAASTFEKYLLLGNYSLVERRQVSELLKEQSFQMSGAVDPATIKRIGKILGVDALAIGNITDFSNTRQQTVMVDVPQEVSSPIYGRTVTERQVGDTTIRDVTRTVTGYAYSETMQIVPETETVPARVGLSVRLVDVETAQIYWSGSGSSEGDSLSTAAEDASSKIMQAVIKQLQAARH